MKKVLKSILFRSYSVHIHFMILFSFSFTPSPKKYIFIDLEILPPRLQRSGYGPHLLSVFPGLLMWLSRFHSQCMNAIAQHTLQ